MSFLVKSMIGRPIISSFSTSGRSDAATKLFSFLNLPDGWHYGTGSAPLMGTIINSLRLMIGLKSIGAERFEVFPGTQGEIMISAYSGDICIDATVFPNSCVKYVVENGDVEINEGKSTTIESFLKKVEVQKWLDQGSSDSSIPNTIATKKVDSNLWHSMTQMAQVFQLSMRPV